MNHQVSNMGLAKDERTQTLQDKYMREIAPEIHPSVERVSLPESQREQA